MTIPICPVELQRHPELLNLQQMGQARVRPDDQGADKRFKHARFTLAGDIPKFSAVCLMDAEC